MPYAVAAKNLMLAALAGTNPTTPITHVGIFDADAGKAVTGTASSDIFTSTAHGYANGDLVLLSALTGGAGLVVGAPYFVINLAANTFQLAQVPAGAAVNFTTDLTVGTVTRLVELSGGSPAYARKAIAYNAPTEGTMDDSTNGAVVDVPAGAVTDYVGYFSASTAGTLLAINVGSPVETFVGQGTYTVTDSDLNLNAA